MPRKDFTSVLVIDDRPDLRHGLQGRKRDLPLGDIPDPIPPRLFESGDEHQSIVLHVVGQGCREYRGACFIENMERRFSAHEM